MRGMAVRTKWGIFAITATLAAFLVAGSAQGLNQTFTVNHASDAVDRAPGNGRCETSTNGRCTLRAAIQEANALSGHDAIQFSPVTSPRTHALAIAPSGDNLANNGDYDITGPVTITGQGAALTIVDGGNPPAGAPATVRGIDRLFQVHPNAGNVTIKGLTVREAHAAEHGGGIHNASTGTLRLENVHVLDSYAAKYGGGVNNAGRGRVELIGSTLSGNGAVEGGGAVNNAAAGTVAILAGSEVSGNPGPVVPDPTDPTKIVLADPTDYPLGPGAIHNQAEGDAIGTIRIADSKVSGNNANEEGAGISNARDGSIVVERSTVSDNTTQGNGGGIYTTSGTVTVTGTASSPSEISGNRAHNGGGIYNAGELAKSSARSRVEITRSKLTGNEARGAGGGVDNGLEGELVVTDATFSTNEAGGDGGGVSSRDKTSLVVTRGTFSENTAGGGGGISFGAERNLTISDSAFTNNRAGPDGGGGLRTAGSGTVDVTNSTFTANKTVGDALIAGGDGGGIGLHSFGTVRISDSQVSGNESQSNGGGVENSANRVTLERLTIKDNTAAHDGGGAHNTSSGEFVVEDTTLENNSAENGGGFANAADSALVLRRSLLLGNTARRGESEESGLGGGFYNLSDGGAKIENTTLSSNTARTAGGGLFTDADAGLNVINATIWRNSATLGGGISFEIGGSVNFPVVPSTAVILRNTIVAGSLNGGSCEGAVGSEGGNIESGTSCHFQGPRDRVNARPGLDAIADNGGPTMTHALRPESLAVDGGVSTITTVDDVTIPSCPDNDQRGVPRPKNNGCDVGAYEYEGPVGPRDEVAPDTTLIDPPSRVGETATFRFTGSDNTTTDSELMFECRILNNDPTEPPEPPDPTEPPDPEFAFLPCASPWEVLSIEEGANTLEVRAVDRAGNVDESPATHEFLGGQDVTPPETTIVEKPPDPSTGRAATFTFDATDDATPRSLIEIECRIDSRDPEAWLECLNPTTFSDLTTGRHTVEARAVDEGDNIDPTPARYTWTVSEPANCDDANITLGADKDVWVDQANPLENQALLDELAVRSGDPGTNARSLIRFALPNDASNCQLESATLRLHATSSTPGRTLEAAPIDSDWSEGGVTWNNQPGTTGTAATATSGDGYREWNLTPQVLDMISGSPNHGFMVRDAAEEDPEGGPQAFASREAPQDPPTVTLPQLVLRYQAATDPPPPPPAAPEPAEVSCGQVLTRSTLVTNDLTNCPGEGLVIGAPNIEVDLDGHTIDGPDYLAMIAQGQSIPEEGLPAGIRNGGHDNVIIRNGTIKEFGHGVQLTAGTKRGVVEGLTTRRNAITGIELSDADDGRTGNQVRTNTVEDNELGIALVNGSENTTVYDNTMTGNLNFAVLVRDSRGNRVESNDISGATSDPQLDSDGGITLEGATANVLLNNTVAATGDAGIVIHAGSHGNRVEGSTLTRTGDAGVSIQDSDRNEVLNNVAHQMSDSGIGLSAANDGLVRGNDVRYNPGGIELAGENNAVELNDASDSRGTGIRASGLGNEIVGNTANRTGGAGIAVETEALNANGAPIEGNTIRGNTTNQNPADGITVAAGGHVISANDAHNNSAWGISAGENADDGGGNRASGNAEPPQCRGVACDASGSVPVVPPDTTRPDTIITGNPESLSTETSATFRFTGTDEGTPATALRFECRLDPAPFTPPPPDPDPDPTEPPDPVDPTDPNSWEECASPAKYSDLEPGEHTFEVRAIDPSDLRDFSQASFTWTIEPRPEEPGPDSTPPDTRITDKPADPSALDTATFRFTGTDDATPGPDLAFECRLDGQGDEGFGPCASPQTYDGLGEGSHTFDVRAVDRSGNADPTPATHTWAYEPPPPDDAAPETTIDSAPDPTTVNTDARFAFSANEPDASFECSLDNVPFEACEAPKEYAGLSVGAHEFRVRATDAAGNADETPAGHAWEIGPAPEPAEVACGQVLTRSTLVTNDLTDCSGDGLVVGAGGITLDLDGHTIDGAGLGTGVRNEGFDSVTVTNGTVQEFDTGLLLGTGTALNVVSSVRAESNQLLGIELADADDGSRGNTLRANTVSGNALGILLANGTQNAVVLDNTVGANTGEGIRVENSNGNRLDGNRVSGSTGGGVALESADGNVVVRNTLSANDAGGIVVGALGQPSNGNRIENNTVNESGAAGILVAESTGNDLLGNTTHSSNDAGIALENAHNNVLRGNDARFNPGGISLSASTGNRLEANNASETSGTGISLEALSLDNDLVQNTANNNDAEGVHVGDLAPAGSGNLIDRNTASGNTASGISVTDVGHTIVGNTANDNGAWGIYAAQGTAEGFNTDGGGNRASGNVEREQCFQVRCDGTGPLPPETAPPDTSIVDKPADPSNSRNATFTFTGTDENTPVAELAFQCRLDGQNEADFVDCENPQTYTNLSAGPHTFEVRAVDGAENVDPTPATHTWTYEALPTGVAPDTEIKLKPEAETPLLEALFTFSANEPDATFECKLDTGPFEPCEFAAEYDFEETQVGEHTFQVRATDFEGNTDPTPASHTWTITGVVTTFTAGPAFEPGVPPDPPTGGETESTDATFEFSANAADATYECSLDRAAFEPCESPLTYTGLAVGSHELRVVATDPEGRTELEPAVYEWTVVASQDTTPPNTAITSQPANNSSSATFAFTGTDNVTPTPALTYECRLDSTLEEDFSSCTSPYNLLEFFPPEALAPGEHTFEVRAVDDADPQGNVDPTPASYTWTAVADSEAPETTITARPAASTAETTALFEFTGNDNATPTTDLVFECKLDSEPDFAECSSPHELQNLEAGEHTLAVRASDLSGNADATPASHTWRIEPQNTAAGTNVAVEIASPDGTPATVLFAQVSRAGNTTMTAASQPPPLPEGFQVGASYYDVSTTATFTGSAEVCIGYDPAASTDPPRILHHENGAWADVTSGPPNNGLVCGTVQSLSPFAVAVPADTGAPETAITAKPAAESNSASAAFAFTGTDNRTPENELRFECRLDGGAWEACTSPKNYAGLGEGSHTFEARAVDGSGNADGSPESHVWTVDTTAPQTALGATGPSGATTATTATFAFSADEAGSKFECSLDGAPFVGCASPKEYTGLAAGDHEFRVRAVDRAGNVDGSPESRAWAVEAQPACTAATVAARANADGWVLQSSATSNMGADSVLKVDTKAGGNARALVRFGLPAIPAGCQVADANLRLYSSSFKAGRTLQALPLGGPWTESAVNWSNQPATVGAAVTAASASAPGYVQWNVTSQVQGMYSSANNGFLIRDSVEGAGGLEQAFHSREKADNPPQLVVTFR